MDTIYPAGWESLKHPWTRQQLLETLRQLEADDPCAIWEQERQMGHISGFTWFVVDWLFDAAVIDENSIGFCLFDGDEVRAIDAVKELIAKISNAMPHASDADAVAHPLWPEVKRLAREASEKLKLHA